MNIPGLTLRSGAVAGVDILGFVVLVIGVFWIAQAFAERPLSDVWWLTLIAGVLMVILACATRS